MNQPPMSMLRLNLTSTIPSKNLSGLSNVKISVAVESTNGTTTLMTLTLIAVKKPLVALLNHAPSVVHPLTAFSMPMLITHMVVVQLSPKVLSAMVKIIALVQYHQFAFLATNVVMDALSLKVLVQMAVVQSTLAPSMSVSAGVVITLVSVLLTQVVTQLSVLNSNSTVMTASKNV